MLKVAVIGASGYVGCELIRVLSQHPYVEIAKIYSHTHTQDTSYLDVYPHYQHIFQKRFSPYQLNEIAEGVDVIFSALPAGYAQDIATVAMKENKQFIDLSPDLRHIDIVYGLAEIGFREAIQNSKIIANPGCYATSCLLAIYPLLKQNISFQHPIIFDAKSGISGAGRKAEMTYGFSEITENLSVYNIAGKHRHIPEIESIIARQFSKNLNVQLTPHLIPVARGLMSVAYISLNEKLSLKAAHELYRSIYQNDVFIRIHKLETLPQIKYVRGSNYCDLGLALDERLNQLIVISVIDNLGKGAALQAIQNFNLMNQLDETLGLQTLTPLYP